MSAELLLNVDLIERGKARRVCISAPRDTARETYMHHRKTLKPGCGVRIYKPREKPLPLKLTHSIRPSRATNEACSRWPISHKAEMMAEHIKRIGQVEIPLFRGRHVRDFNEALLGRLRDRIVWITYVDESVSVEFDGVTYWVR